MESGYKRSLSAFVLIVLVSGFALENSNALDAKCYALCFLKCSIKTFNPFDCGVQCFGQCMAPETSSLRSLDDGVKHCALGCSVSKCSRISTKDDPKVEDVEKCANECIGSCIGYKKN
uniref:Thionin-like protein 2 n=1 Tax=Kalanchoe fedtschenkoi TaxID=63787 RepID=A0A7N0UBI5_KALFE